MWSSHIFFYIQAEIRKLHNKLKAIIGVSARHSIVVEISGEKRKKCCGVNCGTKDENDTICTEPSNLELIVVGYSQKRFSSKGTNHIYQVIEKVQSRITAKKNTFLCRPYHLDEVFVTLNQMHPEKALDLDGMNPYFYQKF